MEETNEILVQKEKNHDFALGHTGVGRHGELGVFPLHILHKISSCLQRDRIITFGGFNLAKGFLMYRKE